MRRLLVLIVVGLAVGVPAGGLAAGGTSLAVDPAPLSSVTLGCTFTLSGAGYPFPSSVSFEVTGPKKADPPIHYFTAGEPVGADGKFSDTWTAWWSVAGDYQITSFWKDIRGASHKGSVVKFTVVPAAPCT
jgi:hypothetical protein